MFGNVGHDNVNVTYLSVMFPLSRLKYCFGLSLKALSCQGGNSIRLAMRFVAARICTNI